MPTIHFHCPLCAATGVDVILTAEIDTATGRATVADLSGCPHADQFGKIGGLTLDEERRLINAALDAFEQRDDDNPLQQIDAI